jgi:antitoxin SocA-like protein
MKFDFDLQKSIAATAYLAERSARKSTVLFLIKMLYAADRNALLNWHRTITGDSPVSMDNGPVLSCIYNLMNGKGPKAHRLEWEKVFEDRQENLIKVRSAVDLTSLLDALSDREIASLDAARVKVSGVKEKIADWAHKEFPEWENPKSSSKPIDFERVLSVAGHSANEIEGIVAEVTAIQSAKRALKAA